MFGGRTEALTALATFHQERGRTSAAVLDIRRMSVGDWLTDWLELVEGQVDAGHLARRTASGYEEVVRIHLVPALGHLCVGDLNHLVVHRFLMGLKDTRGLSDRTRQRVYRVFHRAMADCPLSDNPVALPKHLRPVVRDQQEVQRPTPDQVHQFLEHTSACPRSMYMHPLYQVAATTGMRRGELAGLGWDAIDLGAGMIRVDRSVGVDRGSVFVKTPKSRAGVRVLGLDVETSEVLRRHWARLQDDRVGAGADYLALVLGLDLAFRRGPGGGLLRPDRISPHFRREWSHAGLPDGVTLHGLRHMTASILATSGMSLVEVAAHMGHTVETLQRIYARDLDPVGREERVVEIVGRALTTK